MDKNVPEETRREDEFEAFVAAALKVDPKGLSGKHRRDTPPRQETDTADGESDT